MSQTYMYYVIVPIEGLHLSCDFRIYSAELYGHSPNYTPNPDFVSVYRQPYELLARIPFKEYKNLTQTFTIDDITIEKMVYLSNLKLKDFTCLAFEIELDSPNYVSNNSPIVDNALLQDLLNKGEKILDVLRLSLFKPGEEKSIGRLGALGGGVYGAWLGRNDKNPKFIARKISRYQLVQPLLDITAEDIGLIIYYDFTFRALLPVACSSLEITNPILVRVFEGLRAFRESREMQSWEARFRHLGAIAEGLAKKKDERLQGKKLRNRIAKITTNGWNLCVNYGSSVLMPKNLRKEQYNQFYRRQREMGWETVEMAEGVVADLWDNVRNPLSHGIDTYTSLGRDPLQDMINMERVVITMLNGICAAYEVEELMESSAYDILLEEQKE